MASIPFADNFLAGSLLTLLLPVCLLIAIAIWYTIAFMKVPDTPDTSPSLPPSEVVGAASPSTAGSAPTPTSTSASQAQPGTGQPAQSGAQPQSSPEAAPEPQQTNPPASGA